MALGQWFVEVGGWVPVWCAGADGLHLPLCAGHDPGRFVLMTYFVWLNKWEKKKNGSVEPCNLDTDCVRVALLLAMGRDEHARAVRWLALIGA